MARPKTKAKPKSKVKAKSAGRPTAKAPKAKAKATGRPVPPSAKLAARSKTPAGIRPVKDRVLVKRVDKGDEKVGRLYVPDSAREKPLEAEVVAVGSGRVLKNGAKVPLQLKPGDRVLVGKWSGSEVKLGDIEYLILREEEILGILG